LKIVHPTQPIPPKYIHVHVQYAAQKIFLENIFLGDMFDIRSWFCASLLNVQHTHTYIYKNNLKIPAPDIDGHYGQKEKQ